jgi:hypothetical protein
MLKDEFLYRAGFTSSCGIDVSGATEEHLRNVYLSNSLFERVEIADDLQEILD